MRIFGIFPKPHVAANKKMRKTRYCRKCGKLFSYYGMRVARRVCDDCLEENAKDMRTKKKTGRIHPLILNCLLRKEVKKHDKTSIYSK